MLEHLGIYKTLQKHFQFVVESVTQWKLGISLTQYSRKYCRRHKSSLPVRFKTTETDPETIKGLEFRGQF